MKRNSILGLVAAMMMISCVGTKDVKYLQKNENLEINSEGLVPYNIPVYRVTKNDILSLNVITTPKGDAAQFYSSYNTSGSSVPGGTIVGSNGVTMTGGHGTGAAFAPTFTEMGLKGANTFAAAAATFGLVVGSLMGGPLGAALIRKNNLKSKGEEYTDKKLEMESESEQVNFEEIFRATAIIVVAVAVGSLISIPLKNVQLPIIGPTGDPMKLNLPAYVPSMIIASIILNVGEGTGAYHINQKATNIVGTIGLNAFLSLALTGLKLWELADVAGPMLIILGVQTVVMFLFAYFVTFNIMGKDFDAATIAGGHCGFGMGATPNGVANMTSIQEEFGPAPRAFFILPIVGAFLIDFTNMLVITIFMQFAG